MLKLVNIFKNYEEVNVLRNVNVDFQSHSFNVLIGKSGSGKTTLLNIIGGLDDPSAGAIIYDEAEINHKNIDAYRNTVVGIVFQEINLIEDFTIKQNLKLAFELAKKEMNEENIIDVLAKVNLPDEGDTLEELLLKKPNQLSVGQMQRVAIARSLIKDPQILLLDEPTSALDEENAQSIVSLLKELSKECTIIVSTHARNIFDEAADQIVELKEKTAIISKNLAKVEDFSKKEQKFKKGFLSFFETFKFAIRNLKHKKVRLATSLIIGLISSLLFGGSYLIYTCDNNAILLRNQLNNNIQTASIVKYLTYYDHSSYFAQTRTESFNEEEVEKINEYTDGAYTGLSNSGIKILRADTSSSTSNSLFLARYSSCFSTIYLGSINETSASAFEFAPYEGVSSKTSRLPQNENEIVISRLLAEVLVSNTFTVELNGIETGDYYTLSSVDDLIDMELYGYTIVGIYSMNGDMFDFWKPYISLSDDELTNDPSIDYDYLLKKMGSGFSISQCIFMYNENYTNASSRYLIKFKGNYSEDFDFINSFKVNDTFVDISNQYNDFTNIISALTNETVSIFLWCIIIVFLIISFLMSLNLFYANVKSMEKNLGILKAIGSSKEQTTLIVTSQTMFVTLIEYVLTLIGIGIFSVVFNNYYQLSILVLDISLIMVLLAILVVFALLVSLIASRKALLGRPINVIENK